MHRRRIYSNTVMPLRDHYRPPLDDETSWEGSHGGWPMMIVAELATKLPPHCVAAPRVHAETSAKIEEGGGMATAVWSPPRATLALPAQPPAPLDAPDRGSPS
ncbi:MAG: hypothetical protein GXY83_32820 [Rhodopirellula sp.]|nr:hypothetical protein [Rhodopirellula sp.]